MIMYYPGCISAVIGFFLYSARLRIQAQTWAGIFCLSELISIHSHKCKRLQSFGFGLRSFLVIHKLLIFQVFQIKTDLGYAHKIPTSVHTTFLKVGNGFNIKTLATHMTRLASKNRERHALAFFAPHL